MSNFKDQIFTTLDSDGGTCKWFVTKEKDLITLERKYEHHPDFYDIITYDDQLNFTYSFKHGNGEGEIKIPNGSAFTISDAITILTKLKLFGGDPIRVFKDEI